MIEILNYGFLLSFRAINAMHKLQELRYAVENKLISSANSGR